MTGYKVTDLSDMVEYDPNDLVSVVDVSTNTTRKYKLSDMIRNDNYYRQSIINCVLNSEGYPAFMSLFGDGISATDTLDILGDGSCTDLFTLNTTLNNKSQTSVILTSSIPIVPYTPALFKSQGVILANNTLHTNIINLPKGLSFWFKPRLNKEQTVLSFDTFFLKLESLSALSLISLNETKIIPFDFTQTDWFNIFINNNNGDLALYINGVYISSVNEILSVSSIIWGDIVLSPEGIIDQIRFFNKNLNINEILQVYYEQLGTFNPKISTPLQLTIANGYTDVGLTLNTSISGTAIYGATNNILIDIKGVLINHPIAPVVSRGFISEDAPLVHFDFDNGGSTYTVDEYNHVMQCYDNCFILDNNDTVFGSNKTLTLTGGYASFQFPKININMFTIRMKVKFNNTGLAQVLLTANEDTKFIKLVLDNNKFIYFGNSTSPTEWDITGINGYPGATSIQYGVWYDLEIVNTGSKFISFINGVVDVEMSTTLKISTPTEVRLGSSIVNDSFMNGFIDDIEVLPYANHITNFTPNAVPASIKSMFWFNLNDYTMRFGYPDFWEIRPCIQIASVDVYGDGSIVNPKYVNPNSNIKDGL